MFPKMYVFDVHVRYNADNTTLRDNLVPRLSMTQQFLRKFENYASLDTFGRTAIPEDDRR